MKSFALAALLSVVLADDPAPVAKPVGTTCTASADCGDATTMCCGIFAAGKMCKTAACTDITSATATPNILGCNMSDKTKMEDFVLIQPNADKSVMTWTQYPKASFTCMSGAKALAASGIAMIAAATMM